MTPSPPWSVTYADGAANRYQFDATTAAVHFVYEPVTPELSSTGLYSGGDPRDEQLAVDDPRIDALWRLVVALEADRARHAEERNKGDGAVTITTAGASRHFLVVRAATRELEALLEHQFRRAP